MWPCNSAIVQLEIAATAVPVLPLENHLAITSQRQLRCGKDWAIQYMHTEEDSLGMNCGVLRGQARASTEAPQGCKIMQIHISAKRFMFSSCPKPPLCLCK